MTCLRERNPHYTHVTYHEHRNVCRDIPERFGLGEKRRPTCAVACCRLKLRPACLPAAVQLSDFFLWLFDFLKKIDFWIYTDQWLYSDLNMIAITFVENITDVIRTATISLTHQHVARCCAGSPPDQDSDHRHKRHSDLQRASQKNSKLQIKKAQHLDSRCVLLQHLGRWGKNTSRIQHKRS